MFVAIAAVIVAIAALVPSTLLPDERLGASPAAAETLERFAAVAAAQPAARPGRYLYTKARTLYLSIAADPPEFSVLIPAVRESWIAADGSGRIRETGGKPIFMNERDRERWLSTGGWEGERPPSEQRFGPRPHWVEPAGLPTDTDALEQALRENAETENPPPEDGYTLAGEMLEQIKSLLHSPAASPKLRAALYRVMARLPGVELVGDVADPVGRRGVAISGPGFYDDGETARRQLIIAPETAEVLADQTILRKRVAWIDAEPPLVIGEVVYLESGWVDSLDERPTAS